MIVTSTRYGTEVLGVREDDVCFSAAKLFFAYGLGNAMSFPLWAGATTVLAGGRPTPELTFEVIERFRPTLYFGVPTLYAAQIAALEHARPDLSSLRLCVSAGEALPAELFHRWKARTGLAIVDGIGSTELLHIFISNRPDDVGPGTSGRPVPGYAARIVGEDGEPVARGKPGRLLVRGESAASRYWNDPERTLCTMLASGFVDTGDTYREDEDGRYVHLGRSDDMLKVGGIWVSPVEIEAALVAHPAVVEASIVGRRDGDGLVKPEAFVVLRDPGRSRDGLDRELTDHLKKSLAPYKYPRWYRFVEELPRTATGKVQRFRLRDPRG
jgi:benzoate-CoA ligase family protein